MPITQTIDHALASHVGAGGIPDADFSRNLEALSEAVAELREAYHSGSLALLRYPERTDDFSELQAAAQEFMSGMSDLIFLGTGGSSLGGQSLAQMAGRFMLPQVNMARATPRLHFLDNLDPTSFDACLEKLDLRTSRFIAISKSGSTGETLAQTILTIEALEKAGLPVAHHLWALSENAREGKTHALRALLAPYGVRFLLHDHGVGGRYTVLTNVGLLPALCAGLDGEAFRRGAWSALAPLAQGKILSDIPAAVGAALSVTASQSGKSAQVMLAYADVLERTTRWWAQLWGESLGKQGMGSTPVPAVGPVDQHSQLQLWLAGPRDKLVTVLSANRAGQGRPMRPDLAERCAEPVFAGRTMGDLTTAQARATIDTLVKNGIPTRTFHFARLDAEALGAFMMHMMLETILAGKLMGIDPYDQPAVEEGKILAKQYMANKT